MDSTAPTNRESDIPRMDASSEVAAHTLSGATEDDKMMRTFIQDAGIRKEGVPGVAQQAVVPVQHHTVSPMDMTKINKYIRPAPKQQQQKHQGEQSEELATSETSVGSTGWDHSTGATTVRSIEASTLEGLSAMYHAAKRGFKVAQTVPTPSTIRKIRGPFYLGRMLTEAHEQGDAMGLPDVDPDMTLHNMDVVIRKRLKGVTVKQYYDTIWSEGVNTDKEPFYGPWLSDGGNNKVNVEDWEFAKEGNEFTANWNGEKYTQKRVVNIEFVRTTHTTIGPPVIHVKHTQYCRNDGHDRCVLAMTVEIRGVPLTDSFNVEIRWVASRVGTTDIFIEVGLVVVFVKSNILASQIKAGAKKETLKGQTNLLENIISACRAEAEDPEGAEYALAEPPQPVLSCSRLGDFLSKLFRRPRGILANRDDAIALKMREVDERFQAILSALENSNPTTTRAPLKREADIVGGLSSASAFLEQVRSYLD